ncbi:flagellar export chaperone FlgN [Nocardioides massiliensis]|uniref:Flagellar protein FlgN n=1 Tax=Nocardioides massiliensis TaxID=1325935 RepID=A0ABT9NMS7_9ACTN|nr:flagellar export chaperone FlgN [Nocardioides massiliensis]MDP9821723.1 hypothetical protein [Nocardioides massiliensis]
MENLSLILWRERELLQTLLYRLEQEQLVLANGRTRWLARAAREVEAVLESLRETELLRAVAADEAAAALGMTANPSLRVLAEHSEEPWRTILLDHREAFVGYTQEIMELASANRELLTAGYQAARETLLALGDGASGYAPDGSAVADEPRQRLLDRSI